MLSAQLASRQLDTQGQRLRILQGGWDHNANGHLEFLAIHEPVDTVAPSEVVYYEDTGSDSLTPLWRYRLDAGTLTEVMDAGVADLDGDGLPELAVLLHVHTQKLKSSPAWLRVFAWDSTVAAFSAEPAWQWDYRGRGTSYLRPRQLVVADLDLDGSDDLIITTGNPDRMVLIAGLQDGRFRAREALRPKSITTGPWPFSVALADFDADGRGDILIMGHDTPPKFLAYRNTPAGFVEAPVPGLNGGRIRPDLVATADINGDGREEVVLAQTDGGLVLVNQVGEALRATFLDTEISSLLAIAAADLDGDGSSELIYLAADGTVSTNDPRFVAPITREQVLAGLPPGAAAPEYGDFLLLPPEADGAVAIAFPVHSSAGTFLALGKMAEVLPRPVTGLADEARPELIPTVPLLADEPFAVQEEGQAVYFPERPWSPDPRALPPHQTPDVLLYVGDEFTEHVLEDRADQFAGFRFMQKAPGMVFNFQRQSIVWQPTDEQLGAWHVAYEISFYRGVRPEEAITDSVLLSPKDLVREELLIYVNDKPAITSRPETLHLLARQLFAYRILVNDRNPDARLDYRLESGPEGMSIGAEGILTWRTNETHHDDYQVVISVSDGFDKDVQTFTLDVNAELTITSVVPHVAHLQIPYRYQVMYFQPGARREHSFSLLQAPDGMTVDTAGLITWTPTPAQIDTHSFQVRISDGTSEDVQVGWVMVNAQPKIVRAPPPAVVVLAGDTLRLTFEGRDPNASQAPQWDLAGGPVRMTVDSAGVLAWPTSSQDLDAARYVLTLSDGVDETQFKGIVFVNSPVSITSTPPDSAIVGRQYRYPLTIRDDNRASLLKFRRPTVVTNLDRTVAYQVEVLDDKIRRDLPRYLAQFRELQNIFINKPRRPGEGDVAQAARIDLKQHVKHLFVSEDKLVLVIHSPKQGFVELEDVLWELFQGGRGIMPQYTAERVPFFHYSLQGFPDGMTVDDDGVVTWRPTPSQAGYHQVRLTVSDGFTRAEQSFQVYANHAPAIISQPDTLAVTDQPYTYQVRADDKNADARLTYRLIRHPEGMQVDARGVVTWLPSVEQLNWQEFEIEVSDGHASDRQSATVFVNMLPRIISQPRPVALNNFEYRYRLVAEDLNRDDIQYNATRLPRYSDFDPRTGLFKWRPRDIQKGANDVILEVTDTHGGVTVHEFQIHVFEDPSRRQFLFTGWPLMLAFVGIIFVLGIAVGA